jgi:hypothetical protein
MIRRFGAGFSATPGTRFRLEMLNGFWTSSDLGPSFDQAMKSRRFQNSRRDHAAVAKQGIPRRSCVWRRSRLEVSWMYGSRLAIDGLR